MQKKSISLAGHKTSIALEEEFWRALDGIAAARGKTLSALILEIDKCRIKNAPVTDQPPRNLASALRVFCLQTPAPVPFVPPHHRKG